MDASSTPGDLMGVAGWNCNSLGPIENQKRFIRKIRGMKDSIIVLVTPDLERAKRKHLGNYGGKEYFSILTVATKEELLY